ncbi:hypothetical protein M422DRAFT_270273 [Sphaerobolus stellatus SS14]|uniref:Uncharacterized protein n=1 Tax=Sphaerobolus stellatus (strain SS14) TaxID=990650 RepID=A0A0C9U2R6_SPHS4|nr:hypothetical protein M422DRAFT_270273 [Sphaerobolus stellatus SS14]
MGKGQGQVDWSGLPGHFSEEAIGFWDALIVQFHTQGKKYITEGHEFTHILYWE